jgi:hypothetical protein
MVRPIGVFLMLFALLSLIVHQIGMFELLGAVGTAFLALDVVLARSSKSTRAGTSLREPLL